MIDARRSNATISSDPPSPARVRGELFLISWLILFLELACIRWFPAHILFLTFFTNVVLLACFLGMSLGCLAADRPRTYVGWTPLLLGLGLAAGHCAERLGTSPTTYINVESAEASPTVYFGSQFRTPDVANFVIPIEVVNGFFFLMITLILVGPGQELGRALNRMSSRLEAYAINIVGSIVGIASFALCSWCELPPYAWFLPVAVGLGYFLWEPPMLRKVPLVLLLAAVPMVASVRTGTTTENGQVVAEHHWSPYYRIDYLVPTRGIVVNLIGHQQMDAIQSVHPAYALPYLFQRDAGLPKFRDVLIIGAGSGNDLSRALQWGAEHVDAVEIDPVIQKLGIRDHPNQPYQDPRTRRIVNDGRNFLRATDRQYDLIIYALVDSLVLHSSYNNLRLESFLFTRQAFEDVRARLKPGGLFVMYNYFRQGWIVARLQRQLEQVFGGPPPLVFTFPYLREIPATYYQGFTMFIAGTSDGWRTAFERQPQYWLRKNQPPGPDSANGFASPKAEERRRQLEAPADSTDSAVGEWYQFGPAKVAPADEAQWLATDDWPFLYQQQPMVSDLTWRAIGIMTGLAAALLCLFWPKGQGRRGSWGLLARLFLLGAGFMLIETKAVVHLALLFGSTWMVNTVVFLAVLVMILAANLFVLKVRPRREWPYYLGLFMALGLNVIVPLDAFLGWSRTLQVVLSCSLVFSPILFAGVIFPLSFARSKRPDMAFGANIAGAMLGGLAENLSMILGFQQLLLVAAGFYALSWLTGNRD